MSNRQLKYTVFNNDPFESHQIALDLLGDAKRVLEIGSATGYISEAIIRRGANVVAVEIDPEAGAVAQKKGIDTRIGTVDAVIRQEEMFDAVLLLDVLEHVTDVGSLLDHCIAHLVRDGRVVLSVPNIAHWSVRWSLLRGRFNYTSTGLLDDTHVHFYTAASLERLLTSHGLSITHRRHSIGAFSYSPLRSHELQWQRRKIMHAAAVLWPTLFGYQFVWKAELAR